MAEAQQDPNMQVDTDTTDDEVLLAATNHDLEALKKLLRTGSARIQDPESGFSPLHAAIAACEPDAEVPSEETNKEGDAVHGNALSEDSALATIHLLFENGAIWNELDKNDETPGCLALRLGLKKIYEACVAAGVRAELLFNRLDEYLPLPGGGQDEDDHDDDAIDGFDPMPSGGDVAQQNAANGTTNGHANGDSLGFSGFEPAPNPSYKADESSQADAASGAAATEEQPTLSNPNVDSDAYLASKLTYSEGRLLDSDKNAVMMDWETEIMKVSADQLCTKKGLRTMNIGHGMGIVDTMFVNNEPEMHHIIEAHPEVMQQMRKTGWYDKPNVTVHEGKWQEVLPKLIEQGVVLDGIYYDTYAEDYKDLKELFSEYVIQLLDSNGKFGFYNGLGADRQVCYDVYTKVVEIELFDAGLDVEWTILQVPDLVHNNKPGSSWGGIRRSYWEVPEYRLPTCKFIG
ncbi:Protein arginine N-methyltransferase 2 [Pseudocercospora fuligena]|uniref:Arginine N-methyltransferase 2 n=1 Tax=Pseudocercospora fuligena TaxID=685502 RepID=A0A8H6RW73_9PEZI|nr:Protein arginine N-methyltransferase 2 [Pseudocercospora fuligena]